MASEVAAPRLDDPPIHVDVIERNRWGEGPGRAAIIFRDRDGSIVDWRWDAELKVQKRPGGGWEAVWLDRHPPPKMIHVIARRYLETHTDRDQELWERSRLPEHRRRKLRAQRL